MNPKPTLLLSLVLLFGACRTLEGPILLPVPEDKERVSQWLSRERDAAAKRQSVRAFGKLVLETARGTVRVKQVVIAQQPGQLRLESQNLLGQTQSLLVLDGGEFGFYDGSAIEHGAVTSGLLLESLGLDLAPADAVALLLARPPFPETEVTAVFAQGDLRIATFENARVWFASTGELLGFERLAPDGSLHWRAEFTGWRDLANGRYPFAMQLEFPATELRARLEFQEAVLNLALLESLFRLEPRSHSTN